MLYEIQVESLIAQDSPKIAIVINLSYWVQSYKRAVL